MTTDSTQFDASLSTPASGVSATMVSALESAWVAIRARHPEVPAVVIVVGAGSGRRPGVLKLGHFAALRWTTGTEQIDVEDGEALAEVFVGGEGLARGPVEVLGTLLHEAAHALADVRGVKDTSRQGRWHNSKFKTLAEQLGIEVTKDERIGWSPTSIPAATQEAYGEVVRELGRALRLRRALELGSGEGPEKRPAPPACVCECVRRIRVAPSVLQLGPILCRVCKQEFAPELADDADAGSDAWFSAPRATDRPSSPPPGIGAAPPDCRVSTKNLKRHSLSGLQPHLSSGATRWKSQNSPSTS